MPWNKVAVGVAGLIALAGLGTLIALNWAPEEKIGTVDAPRFDPALAGGGLSSHDLGLDVLVGSLESSQPVGYKIVTDAAEEEVIDDFKEVTPKSGWGSEYDLNGSDFTFRVSGDKKFLLLYPRLEKETADQIFAIARRYGFYTGNVTSELTALEDRTTSLLETFDARPLTVGVAEPDLEAEASTLAADWDAWIRNFGDNPLEARAAEAERQVVLIIAEVAAHPTNPGLDEYNDAIDEMNRAFDAYNENL